MKPAIRILLVSLALIAAPHVAFADESNPIFSSGKFADGARVFLFGENVNVRSAPAVTPGNIVATLPVLHPVTIVGADAETFTVNGYRASWYRISFAWKGKELTGFAWGGFIAPVTLPIDKRTHAVCGISGYDKKKGFSGEVRIVQDGRIVSSSTFKPMQFEQRDGIYEYGISGAVHGGRGIPSAKNIIALKFVYGACGYTNGEILFIYDGKNVHYGIEAPWVAEAGVFHWTKSNIFPADKGGEKNVLLQVEKTENYDEGTGGYVLEKEVKKRFRWSGTMFVEVK